MPKETYGSTQIREVRLTEQEVRQILLENIVKRCKLDSYDFDYKSPIILKEDKEYIFRFIQKSVIRDRDFRLIGMNPMEKYKLEK